MFVSSLSASSHWQPFLTQPVFRDSLAWIAANAATAPEGIHELGQPGWCVNVHGYTTQPALTVGDQARLGRVAPGFLADITVLAEDPVTCPPDDLIADPVVLTVVGGEVVFRGGAIDG